MPEISRQLLQTQGIENERNCLHAVLVFGMLEVTVSYATGRSFFLKYESRRLQTATDLFSASYEVQCSKKRLNVSYTVYTIRRIRTMREHERVYVAMKTTVVTTCACLIRSF
jgi:hypothetical protein